MSIKNISMIIRAPKDKDNPYVMIRRECLNDGNLSWQAKGLLAHLLSKPDDWVIQTHDLVNRSPDGKKTVYSILRELEKFGYLVRSRNRNERGHFVYAIHLYESPYVLSPCASKGDTVKREAVERDTVKGTLLNNDLLNNDLLINPPVSPTQKINHPRKIPPKTPIPENLTLSDEWRQSALAKGMHPDWITDEFERFHHFWWEKAEERKSWKKDWHMTWKVWVSKEVAQYPNKTKRKQIPQSSLPLIRTGLSKEVEEILNEFNH